MTTAFRTPAKPSASSRILHDAPLWRSWKALATSSEPATIGSPARFRRERIDVFARAAVRREGAGYFREIA